MRKVVFTSLLLVLTLLVSNYFFVFYPKQSLPVGKRINVVTTGKKYMNDCFHPCVRYIPEKFAGHSYWMVQSPFYKFNDKVENPILYGFDKIDELKYGIVVCETPAHGYNSDPTLFYKKDTLFIFWREFETPLCDSLGVKAATVGVYSKDGVTFSDKLVYLINRWKDGDTELCPILIKINGIYCFYCEWHQFNPIRENKGIAIWEGTSLINPDFILTNTLPFNNIYTCDKWLQKNIGGKFYYIPKPLKFNLWHFDLFEYKDKLYMVSVSEWSENVMLSVSENHRYFYTFRKPLINSHYSKNFEHYLQSYYKPTGVVVNDTLYLFYTSTTQSNSNHSNDLYLSMIEMKELIK
jgi:hypothetical protein